MRPVKNLEQITTRLALGRTSVVAIPMGARFGIEWLLRRAFPHASVEPLAEQRSFALASTFAFEIKPRGR